MNNQTKLSDNNIPYGQLNNPIVFDEKESLFPDYTGETNSNNFFTSNISNVNYFIKKKILSYESSIINDNIILTINKPAGFDTTLKDFIISFFSFHIVLHQHKIHFLQTACKGDLLNKNYLPV